MQYNGNIPEHRQVLAQTIEQLMSVSGYKKLNRPDCNEDVYSFEVKELANVSILVYSTIVNGAVRDVGSDAIRISVVYNRKDGSAVQLFKLSPVHRTGEIVAIKERLLERMRHGWKTLKTRTLDGNVCRDCGAPMFDTKAGKKACAALCWTKPAVSA